MVTLIYIKNPLEQKPDRILNESNDKTFRELAKAFYDTKNLDDFSAPTTCICNDQPVFRTREEADKWNCKSWDDKPEDGEIVTFATALGDPITILVLVVAVVAAVALSLALSIQSPKVPGDIPEPDPVFTLRGQTNRIRLGDPIEEHYGNVRIWPSYGAISYNKYIDNEQYLYSLFCIGQGHYDVGQIYIEDTEIENFQDVNVQVVAPGGDVTLFRDNVETSVEVAGIELFGSNEPEFDDWVGPFAANSAQTTTDRIEFDITLPNGLYFSNDDGGLSNVTATATIEYREIDDNGDPVGAGNWTTLINFSKTLRTKTPQRFTYSANVTSARYEVRAKRTNDKNTSHRAGNTITWELLRAFRPNVGNYGDVTMLAVEARASNNLNDNSRSQVNLYATRKLPIWSSGSGWSAPTATRSAVWAMCNIFRSENGANIQDDEYFDLEDLVTKDALLTTEGRTFDWSYDTRSTTWDDATLACRAIRGIPLLQGSLITAILERPKSLPSAVFGPDNIVKGSFEWDIKIYNQDEYDGVEIEYTDPTTWKPETIDCVLADSLGDYLDPTKLPGVTDRNWAYREGLYEQSKRRYHRENVSFKTGLEGYIPTYGDLLMVNHDLPRWGQGGRVLNVSGTTITLDTDVTFTEGETHQILIRTKLGGVSGPYQVSAGSNAKEVIAVSIVDDDDFYFDHINEKPIFLFGVSNLEGKLIQVVDIRPSGDDQIEVVGVNYDPRVYAFDSATAPVLTNPSSVIPVPGLPVVNGLTIIVDPENSAQALVSWNAALGATSYVLQYGDSNTNYTDTVNVTTPFAYIPRLYSPLYVRVSGLGTGQGPWASAVSSFSDFAEIEVTLNSAGTPQVIGTSFAKINQFDTDVSETGACDGDHTNDRITVSVAGTYELSATLEFSGTADTTFTGSVRKNGSMIISGSEFSATLGSLGAAITLSVSETFDLSSSDYVELVVKADGATKDFLLENGSFSLGKIA